MTKPKIQSFASLRDEMISVAEGVRKPPPDAAEPSVHSAEVLARLLTPENRRLLSAIRDQNPQSVARLAEITKRAAPNVTRTLDKLAAVGLVRFTTDGRKKVPAIAATKISIEIDPFSARDKIIITPVKPAGVRSPPRGAPGSRVTQ